MTNRYIDLIKQTFDFPQEGFELEGDQLLFHGVSLYDLLKKYGSPLKVSYLPQVSRQIEKARSLFSRAMKTKGYQGGYHYCYCTKSSHFSYILNTVLQKNVNLETSSEFDIDIIEVLLKKGSLNKDITLIHNGFKTKAYIDKIAGLVKNGFKNVLPILDNPTELLYFEEILNEKVNFGIRVATEEEPNFVFYTSRLGIRYSRVLDFYKKRLANHPHFKLKMLHFFVDTGIKDSQYYWNELRKAIKLYTQLAKIAPDLSAINIGGGMPIRNSLGFEFDYAYMIQEIVNNIFQICRENKVKEPDIYTEFGKYTVGESGVMLFSVLDVKQQNDSETWYMVDNSLINTLPDIWGIAERFILLPINRWDKPYQRVNLGGLTCDNSDYYNSEVNQNQVYLPKYQPTESKEKQFLGFFHTGAYQEAIGGYGGIKHCLIPQPQHIVITKDNNNKIIDQLYSPQQSAQQMLSILGY